MSSTECRLDLEHFNLELEMEYDYCDIYIGTADMCAAVEVDDPWSGSAMSEVDDKLMELHRQSGHIQYYDKCQACRKFRARAAQPKYRSSSYIEYLLQSGPNKRVTLDMCHMRFLPWKDKYTYHVCVDNFSRVVSIVPAKKNKNKKDDLLGIVVASKRQYPGLLALEVDAQYFEMDMDGLDIELIKRGTQAHAVLAERYIQKVKRISRRVCEDPGGVFEKALKSSTPVLFCDLLCSAMNSMSSKALGGLSPQQVASSDGADYRIYLGRLLQDGQFSKDTTPPQTGRWCMFYDPGSNVWETGIVIDVDLNAMTAVLQSPKHVKTRLIRWRDIEMLSPECVRLWQLKSSPASGAECSEADSTASDLDAASDVYVDEYVDIVDCIEVCTVDVCNLSVPSPLMLVSVGSKVWNSGQV